ncbi:MAG: glycosyltransferase family 39 protein [bacterium]|nr:glycosyltransferase family 39 protein [bacterium]
MPGESQTFNHPKQRTHPLEVIILLALFVALILFMRSILTVLGIKYGLDFGEGYLANMSLDLVTGINPYHPIENPPWIVSSYPPLYPFLNGVLMLVTEHSLIPGRFIAITSFIGILTLIILFLRKLNANLTAAVIAAGMLLVFPWGIRWAQVVRVDTLGIFLSISGIYLWIKSEKTPDAIFAAILLSLAVFTKHSLLAAPAACLIYGILSRDRRTILLLALLIILVGGSYGITNFITGGGLIKHLFTYTANEWFIERFTAGVGSYFKTSWLLHVLAIGAMLIPGVVSAKRRIIPLYYILSTCTLIAYGFEGSDTNYLIEPLLSVSLLAALTIDHLAFSQNSHKAEIKGIPSPKTICLTIVLAIIILGRFIDQTDFRLHRMTPDRYQTGMQLIRLLNGAPGEILSEDASYTFLAGKEVVFQPYIMSLLARTGKWDQTEFVQTIRDKKYSMLVLRVDLTDPYNTEQQGSAYEMAGFDRWTPEMETAILESYSVFPEGALDTGVGNYWYVYTPKEDLIP